MNTSVLLQKKNLHRNTNQFLNFVRKNKFHKQLRLNYAKVKIMFVLRHMRLICFRPKENTHLFKKHFPKERRQKGLNHL